MDFTGIFQGLSMNYATGKQTVSFELNEDAREAFQDLKGCEKLTIQIKKYRKKRSLDANVETVRAYCQERGNKVDPQAFVDFYESKGWMVGKNKAILRK